MKPAVQRVREIILAADPRVTESIKWKAPTFEPLGAVVEQVRLIDRSARVTAEGLQDLRRLNGDPLRTYLTDINRLEKAGDALYRRAMADLYLFTGEEPARYLLIWKDIVEQLEDALDGFERVADTVESVIIKYA